MLMMTCESICTCVCASRHAIYVNLQFFQAGQACEDVGDVGNLVVCQVPAHTLALISSCTKCKGVETHSYLTQCQL
jgi:hypothetical protein